jgi:hypothetical protein
MKTVKEDLNSRDAYNKRQREIDRENRATLSFGEPVMQWIKNS